MTGLAVPIPYTWQPADTGNAALLNAQIRDPMTFLLNPPAFSAAQTSVQSIANATIVALTWPTPTLDTYGGWASGTPTRYTPQVPGYYDIAATYAAAPNGTGNRDILVNRNGTNIAQCSMPTPSSADDTCIQVTAPLVLFNGTTDYFEIAVVQRSGGALNTVITLTQVDCKWSHAA